MAHIKIPDAFQHEIFDNLLGGESLHFFAIFQPLFERLHRFCRSGSSIGDNLYKLLQMLDSPELMYLATVSLWKNPSSLVIGASEPVTRFTDKNNILNRLDLLQRMMFLDTVTSLPDDFLVIIDRASMGVGLEVRVPFLDHRIVEFIWSLPVNFKIRNGVRKWLLKKILYKYVPKEMVERPKMGFSIPINEWLRADLREWVEELLEKISLKMMPF